MHTGFGDGFDSCSEFSLPGSIMGKSLVTFGVDMRLSVHTDNKKNYNLILDRGPAQELNDITLTAEAQYSINFSRLNRNFVKVCIIMGATVFLLVNVAKMYQFKANDSEIQKQYPLRSGSISKDFIALNMKKQD